MAYFPSPAVWMTCVSCVVTTRGIDMPPEITISVSHIKSNPRLHFFIQRQLSLYFLVAYWSRFLTNPFSNREVRPKNILWADENNISYIKVVSGHKDTAKLLLTRTSMENKSRCDETNCRFPNSWMPYDGNFFESFCLLIWCR